MLKLLVAAALLIPPPLPLPAPDLMEAAAELRRAAPLSADARATALETGTYTVAHRMLTDIKITNPAWLVPVKDRLAARLAADRAQVDEAVDACMDEIFARGHDVETLRGMRQAVSGQGGAALWSLAVRETLQYRYSAEVTQRLNGDGYNAAVAYAITNNLLTRLPDYAPNAADLPERARRLEAACGPGARSRLQQRGSSYGIDGTWLERDIARDGKSAWCLLMVTKVAGFPLSVFDAQRP